MVLDTLVAAAKKWDDAKQLVIIPIYSVAGEAHGLLCRVGRSILHIEENLVRNYGSSILGQVLQREEAEARRKCC